MFEKSDKSLYLLRKITNVAIFVYMFVIVILGIVLICTSFYEVYVPGSGFSKAYYKTEVNVGTLIGGILSILLGPILMQLIWLGCDLKFNSLLDIKNIRNAQYGMPAVEFPAPLFFNKRNKKSDKNVLGVYEELKRYKALLDENALTIEEYEQIKSKLLLNNKGADENIENDIDKVKRLKQYFDDELLTEEEFIAEKSKILKK